MGAMSGCSVSSKVRSFPANELSGIIIRDTDGIGKVEFKLDNVYDGVRG